MASYAAYSVEFGVNGTEMARGRHAIPQLVLVQSHQYIYCRQPEKEDFSSYYSFASFRRGFLQDRGVEIVILSARRGIRVSLALRIGKRAHPLLANVRGGQHFVKSYIRAKFGE